MPAFKRHDGRRADEQRAVRITPDFVATARGSCLIEMGGTRVICTACFVEGLPAWRKGGGSGWLTAEYGMLPASTAGRKPRPGIRPDGRSVEIQRIIGRVLRNVTRLDALGENTLYLDCDVLGADGSTRTASITGAYVALARAAKVMAERGMCQPGAVTGPVAAVSVGIVAGRPMLDLDYSEDSAAEVDMNVAMVASGGGRFVEIQGSSERQPFNQRQLDAMLRLARRGIRQLFEIQTEAVER